MGKWSHEFQNPDFMEKSRMVIMNPEMSGYVAGKLGLKDGMRVLDVGCGIGAFDFYLALVTKNIKYTGVDTDEQFIEKAIERVKEYAGDNSFEFIVANALELPFADDSFDLVVSHTFLTSVPDPMKAMSEMKRVVKNGQLIGSVTAMTFFNQTISPGRWPSEYKWYVRYQQLLEKVQIFYQKYTPIENYIGGLDPKNVPLAFVDAGLKEISAWPIGKFFSLSNAAMNPSDKEKYIKLDYSSEVKRLKFLIDRLKESREYFEEKDILSPEEADEYLDLCRARRDALLKDIGENSIWEWIGDANVLVIGRKDTGESHE